MSSLLSEAIVDAKALREAALKNAETAVLDKYSEEVRYTLEQLIEQDELGADLGAAPVDPMADPMLGGETEEIVTGVPLAATDGLSEEEGENLRHLPKSGQEVEINVDLDALHEAVQQLQDEQEFNLNEEELAAMLSEVDEEGAEDLYDVEETGGSGSSEGSSSAEALAGAAADEDADLKGVKAADATKESLDIDLPDDLIDEIAERLVVDMGPRLQGWAGRTSEDINWQLQKAIAHRRSTEVEKHMKDLKKASEELVFENKQLKKSLEQYKQATEELRENLQDVNLSNARLLYTNRVLRNTSLNERQKLKIADAISKAGSVTEAKTIYHTLENATPAAIKVGPQSLSEAIGRRSTSVIRASRKESTSFDPIADRMKRLAGIK